MKEKVACYIRVSTQEQRLHGLSLDAQRDKLKEYAATHDLQIVGWYEDEGVSGRKVIKNRPELQRMILDAQKGLFDRILFIKLDRFFRSVAEYHECMKQLSPVIWTATEEKYDLSTANGRAFVNMKLTIAELEADQTGERIKIVNEYKVKNGQAVSGDMSITFPFCVKEIDGVKRVVHNPETEAATYFYLQKLLETQSLWNAFRMTYDAFGYIVSYKSFTSMTKDTKLYGFYRGNPQYCEPYITEEEYLRIQEYRGRNIKKTPSGNVYLFSSMIKCPLCGRRLSAKGTKKKSGYLHVMYRCNGHFVNYNCDFSVAVKEKKVEHHLIEYFSKYVNDEITSVSVKDASKPHTGLNERIESIKGELSRLNVMFQKNRISERDYDKEYERLSRELADLEASKEPDAQRDLSKYTEMLETDWIGLYNLLTRENKRTFWRKYIKEIVIDESGQVTGLIF